MKRIMLLCVVLWVGMAGTASAAHSDHGDVGIGVVLGAPVGLSGKFWLNRLAAVDATVGWNFQHQWFVLQSGYLYHFPVEDVPSGFLAVYVGMGGLFEVASQYEPSEDVTVNLYGRVPLGLEYIYRPVSFFAEVDPLIRLYPGLDFAFGGGIGFRFYF